MSGRDINKSEVLFIKKRRRRNHDEDDHGGGTWKIALADFTTALMAFFLLMWLINVVEPEDKKEMQDYFNPFIAEEQTSDRQPTGVISIFDGGMAAGETADSESLRDENSNGENSDSMSMNVPMAPSMDFDTWMLSDPGYQSPEQRIERLRQDLVEKIESDDAIKALRDIVDLDVVDQGLRIRIRDDAGDFSMFQSGSAAVTDRAIGLLEKLSEVLRLSENAIIVSGHTDGVPYRGRRDYSNWELSSDRANAARRVLESFGINPARFKGVEGLADTRPITPENPRDPSNRRIELFIVK